MSTKRPSVVPVEEAVAEAASVAVEEATILVVEEATVVGEVDIVSVGPDCE